MNQLASLPPPETNSALPSHKKIQWIVPPKSIEHKAREAWEQCTTATDVDATIYSEGPQIVGEKSTDMDAVGHAEAATNATDVDTSVHPEETKVMAEESPHTDADAVAHSEGATIATGGLGRSL